MKRKIFIISFTSCLCVLSLLLGVVFGMGINARLSGSAVEKSSDNNKFSVSAPLANSENGIKLISEVTTISAASDDGVIQAYTITATVDGNASDTSVSFNVAYKDGSAVSSDICTYIVNDNQINIAFYRRFNQQIVVTAYANADPTKSATCNIDCNTEYCPSGHFIVNDDVLEPGSYVYYSPSFSITKLTDIDYCNYAGTVEHNHNDAGNGNELVLTEEARIAIKNALGLDNCYIKQYSYAGECFDFLIEDFAELYGCSYNDFLNILLDCEYWFELTFYLDDTFESGVIERTYYSTLCIGAFDVDGGV